MYKRFAGVFLIGIVIKIMDDYLDRDIDRFKEQWNITLIINRGILPYSLVLLIFSLYLNFPEGVSIFAASYLVGMINDLNEKLPTKLYAWQEGIFLIILTTYMSSLKDSISALLIVSSIQIIDDFIDMKKDKYIDNSNIVNKIGKINASIITIVLVLASFKFFFLKSIFYYSAVALLYLIIYLLEKIYGNDKNVD